MSCILCGHAFRRDVRIMQRVVDPNQSVGRSWAAGFSWPAIRIYLFSMQKGNLITLRSRAATHVRGIIRTRHTGSHTVADAHR